MMHFRDVLECVGDKIVSFIGSEERLRLGIAARRLHLGIARARYQELQGKYRTIANRLEQIRIGRRFRSIVRDWLIQNDRPPSPEDRSRMWDAIYTEQNRRARYLNELQAGADDIPSTILRMWG